MTDQTAVIDPDIIGIERALTDDDIRKRAAAVSDGEVPLDWTPEHVGVRLIEASRLLRNEPRVGPRTNANGWPEYRLEFGDRTGSIEDGGADEKRKPATAEEASRMNEALRWPMDYLNGMALESEALMLWAYAKATGRDMDGMLHQRKKRATALASEMMRRANADPHFDPDGKLKDTRSPDVLARNERRRLIAVEIVDALNVRLAVVPKGEHPALVKAAHEALRNRCKAEDCLPAVYRPRDAVPGRVMARTTLDRYRKIAAAAIAAGLRRAGVPVR